jgi:hypothetical protein
MKSRFILFRRAGVFYSKDTVTRKQSSLRTKDEAEAVVLLNAKNESFRQPVLNVQIARAYLTAGDPAFAQRTWQSVMEQMQTHGKDSAKTRCARAMTSKAFDGLRRKKLMETTAEEFLAILNDGKVSVAHYLKRLHNLAVNLGCPPPCQRPLSGQCRHPRHDLGSPARGFPAGNYDSRRRHRDDS